MKKLYLFALGLILSNSIHSQNYVPLLMDSLHTWTWGVDMFGDTIVGETWAGFSYDSNDSLIQRRSPDTRVNYSYGGDTLFLLAEILDADDNWNIVSRTARAFAGGDIQSVLTENYQNGNWENSAVTTYFYESSGRDTLHLIQHWDDGSWVNFYKKEKTFDTNGNCTEEGEFYINSSEVFQYSRGKLFEYDNANHLVQEIGINYSSNGPYYTSRNNWIYGDDNLVDTLTRCEYNYPNDGTCNNIIMATYDYAGQDSIIQKLFTWDDNEWRYYEKELTYTGQEVYSNRPDSIVSFYLLPDDPEHVPFRRWYLQYEELGNDEIYFREEEYYYNQAASEWLLTDVTEEWYHIKPTLAVNPEVITTSLIYPNPCAVGQMLELDGSLQGKANLEVLVFDIHGRLVATHFINGQPDFPSPNGEGMYTIMIRENDQLLGVSKQIIVK